jgi:molecular chaperone GrpE
MRQNGQEQQERRRLQQTFKQPEGKDKPNSVPVLAEEEQTLSEEQQKTQECLDLLRQTQADFVNYRRRMSQEQAEGRIVAQSTLLFHLLPVLDDFGRALAAVPPELATHPWVQGLLLIERRLTTLLEQLGVRRVGVSGETFDPHWHEAIMTEARADVSAGTILHVAQPGYLLGERVIRPAQVSVADISSPTSDLSTEQPEDSE